MRRAALLAGCLLALGMARKPPEGVMEKPILQSWSGAFCSVAAPRTLLLRDVETWRRLWKEAFGKEAPEVDFGDSLAAAVFLGARPTGGFSVDFLPPVQDKDGVTLRYRVSEPEGFVIMAFTQPYAIRLYPDPSLPVKLEESKK